MKFGTGSWFYSEYSVSEAIKKIKNSGFQAVEIWMEHLLKTGEKLSFIKSEAEDLGISLSLHATSYDLNMTSLNKGICKESRKQTIESIITASEIGANIVVIHPGRVSSSKGDVEYYKSELLKFLIEIDNTASSEGVIIGLEIMEKRAREILVYPEEVNILLKNKWKNLKLTLDIAHAGTVMDPSAFINLINHEWITHIHLSDSKADAAHLPLGKGNTDINKALKTLSGFYDKTVIIEGYVPGKGDEVTENNYIYLRKNGWILNDSTGKS